MTYEARTVKKLNHYKRKQNDDELILVPILDKKEDIVGFLRPITVDFRTAIADCVKMLSEWRANAPTLSPTRFQVTYEGTERWLEDLVVNNNQRILFMVQDSAGENIGHMGFANFCYEKQSADVDLVVRGKPGMSPGLMECAIKALVHWGKRELELKHIELDVLWDNKHAISFYERCGFQKGGLVPLTKKEYNGEIRWIAHKNTLFEAEKYYLHMKLC